MRYSTMFRALLRARGLSLAVILTLALGVGLLTTTFSLLNGALWRLPPFPDAGRIALLYLERDPQGEAPRRERWSFARFELLRESQQSFEDVASYSPATLTLSGDAEAEVIQGERVSASYFRVLRVRAILGRVITDAEDDAAAPAPVVVLSHDLWTRRWGADTSVIGRIIRVNGVAMSVIGVLPREFGGLSGSADVWIPRTISPQVTYAEYLTTNQNFISAVGRLRQGTGINAAQSELALLGADINRAIPSDPDDPQERVTATAIPLNEARVDGAVRRSLLILLGGVALLHALACANVINLLLGWAATRRREFAVRIALGTSAHRLFGRMSGEGALLAVLGGLSGVVLAYWASTVIVPPANVWAPRNFYGSLAPFDAPSFGFAEVFFGIALTGATALLVAALPALGVLRLDVLSGIRAGARGVSHGAITLRRPTARGVIVGVEAALAILLLLVAGLLISSFQQMRQTKTGVNSAGVLTFWVIPSEARVPPAAAPEFITRLLDALATVPGVMGATVDGGAPLAGSANTVLFIEGRPTPGSGEAPPVLRHYIAPDHFATLGIPLLRGRAFIAADNAGAANVAIISETAARRFWPDEDPLGQRVWFGAGSAFTSPDSSAEIIGIVGDVVYSPFDQAPNLASFYTPYAQFTYASRMFFLRTTGDPLSIVPEARKAVASVDPELGIRDVQSLDDVVRGSWARRRFDAILFGAFGTAALLLAGSGIFAVLAHAVANRRREFGIRSALGAQPRTVVWHVVREGMAFPLVGMLLGVIVSIAVTRLLQSTLYGISPRDPGVFATSIAVLMVAAASACLIPALRATRVDPTEAMRAD
jgi:putative ABC transport system permease protein